METCKLFRSFIQLFIVDAIEKYIPHNLTFIPVMALLWIKPIWLHYFLLPNDFRQVNIRNNYRSAVLIKRRQGLITNFQYVEALPIKSLTSCLGSLTSFFFFFFGFRGQMALKTKKITIWPEEDWTNFEEIATKNKTIANLFKKKSEFKPNFRPMQPSHLVSRILIAPSERKPVSTWY